MIPANKVGLIIGKGGETIKQLQGKCGCKMMMVQDGPFQNAPEKPLRITGMFLFAVAQCSNTHCDQVLLQLSVALTKKSWSYPSVNVNIISNFSCW